MIGKHATIIFLVAETYIHYMAWIGELISNCE